MLCYPLALPAHRLITQLFLRHKAELLELLPRESHTYEYMKNNMFDPG